MHIRTSKLKVGSRRGETIEVRISKSEDAIPIQDSLMLVRAGTETPPLQKLRELIRNGISRQ